MDVDTCSHLRALSRTSKTSCDKVKFISSTDASSLQCVLQFVCACE